MRLPPLYKTATLPKINTRINHPTKNWEREENAGKFTPKQPKDPNMVVTNKMRLPQAYKTPKPQKPTQMDKPSNQNRERGKTQKSPPTETKQIHPRGKHR
jgi:hypothetical protein